MTMLTCMTVALSLVHVHAQAKRLQTIQAVKQTQVDCHHFDNINFIHIF